MNRVVQRVRRAGWAGAVLLILLLCVAMPAAAAGGNDNGSARAGSFQRFVYSGPAGSRPYMLYVPSGYSPRKPEPLVVMLHGCSQTALSFAASTGMNTLAERERFLVVYPEQTSDNNTLNCWNWFEPVDQEWGMGEPAIIAGITEEVANRYAVDRGRIYVAGLSAGAAMSVVLGADYPYLYAAVGVGSGLEYKAASSLPTALVAMNLGGPDPERQGEAAYIEMGDRAREMPVIVFHGSQDTTVAPVNGRQVVEQWLNTDLYASGGAFFLSYSAPTRQMTRTSTGGRTYTVSVWEDRGKPMIEYWYVLGMGHAWSGGDSSQNYTDPAGPSESEAMWNFFRLHRLTKTEDHAG
jgi:poly(hydroxyalkanoate) depolymerase family esterase